jgi:NTP pyrophosphatase (non-canonical NTP hydrolase)
MRFDEYQALAIRTKNQDLNPTLRRAVSALGLVGEAGELADYIKKEVGHNHTSDLDHIAKELGDVLWYIASVCDEYGLSMQDVASRNIEKLRKRYPDGFSSVDSIRRRDVE